VNTRSILSALGVVALVATTHCDSRYATYCDNVRDCEGGNYRDVDACIERQRALDEISSAYECDDEWDAFADCLETITCNKERAELDATRCKDKSTRWVDCTRKASARPSATSSTSASGSSGSSDTAN